MLLLMLFPGPQAELAWCVFVLSYVVVDVGLGELEDPEVGGVLAG
jgi:hypothetical protein